MHEKCCYAYRDASDIMCLFCYHWYVYVFIIFITLDLYHSAKLMLWSIIAQKILTYLQFLENGFWRNFLISWVAIVHDPQYVVKSQRIQHYNKI